MNRFFQGWYFKCSTGSENIAFIPAVHDNGTDRSISLQIITNNGSFSVSFPEIVFDRLQNTIRMGDNTFSPKGIRLAVQSETIQAHGSVRFSNHQQLARDIMGPFRYIPFMQCSHKIYSMSHSVNGRITINGTAYIFSDGNGYLEGDKGYSFPSEYLWTQCHFPGGSLMLSAGDIPMPGFHFTGIIAAIIIDGQEYRLATYSGARVQCMGNHSITIRQGKYSLSAKLIQQKAFPLHAPHKGDMSRFIRESPSCIARYHFALGDTALLHFQSDLASFEYEYH